MSATASHELLLPRPPGGLLPGAVLALLAHGLLLLALTAAVQWRVSTSDAVSAELWSALPQIAAPAPPPPAPAPPEPAPKPVAKPEPLPPKAEPVQPDPQIAIAQAKAEKERLEKAERAKAEKLARAEQERLRKEKEAEAKKRELAAKEQAAKEQAARDKADEQRLAKERQKFLERMMGQASQGGSTAGTADKTAGPSASYTGRLVAAIKPNIVFTDTVSGNPAAEVEVRAGPSGSIIARRLLRSSGHKDWDEAVLRAIDRTGSLPRDTDGRVPPTIVIAFRPNE